MKKILFLFLVVLGTNTTFAQDIIEIETRENFLQFITDSKANTDGYAGKTIKLTKDIDLMDSAKDGEDKRSEILPIGWTNINEKHIFKGTFDGQGHTISNFKSTIIGYSNLGYGLFWSTNGGIIKNLKIDNATINGNGSKVGVLIGNATASTTIQNCIVTNSSATNTEGGVAIISGRLAASTITNCLVDNCVVNGNNKQSSILASDIWRGPKDCTISNCIVLNSTIITSSPDKGYICSGVGGGYTLHISNCYALGNEKLIPKGVETAQKVILANSAIQEKSFFTSGECSYTLNQVTGNANIWSHDGTSPILADATNLAVDTKAGQTDGTAQAYAIGTKVIAKDFNYIKFDAENSKIADYANLTFFTVPSNGLIYLPAGTNAPTAIENNVIIGETCASLSLTDGSSFVCPTPFTATKATYTRNCYTDGGWESIALPFAVTSIKAGSTDVVSKYTIEGFSQKNENTIRFEPLTGITGWEAGAAYIMKHNTLTTGTQICVFEGGNNVSIAATDAPFMGTFADIAAGEATDNYILIADGTKFMKASDKASIPAFRAYLKASDPANAPISYSVEHGGGATAISGAQAEGINSIYAADGAIIINTDKAQTIHIYGVDGRRVRTVQAAEGETTINGLAQGIYIANNRKVIIK